jgi:hypothetical protein
MLCFWHMPPVPEQPTSAPVPPTTLNTAIKIVRIFLLVLIVVGLGLIATEKLWVPNLVNMILQNQTPIVSTTVSPTLTSSTQSNPPSSKTVLITASSSPISGTAPLTIEFNTSQLASSTGTTYMLRYGEQTALELSGNYDVLKSSYCTNSNPSMCSYIGQHTYAMPGIYTTQLIQQSPDTNYFKRYGQMAYAQDITGSITVTVLPSQGSSPITFDRSIVSTLSDNPRGLGICFPPKTISGIAFNNTSSVKISLFSSALTSSSNPILLTSGTVPVINQKWSFTPTISLPNSSFPLLIVATAINNNGSLISTSTKGVIYLRTYGCD